MNAHQGWFWAPGTWSAWCLWDLSTAHKLSDEVLSLWKYMGKGSEKGRACTQEKINSKGNRETSFSAIASRLCLFESGFLTWFAPLRRPVTIAQWLKSPYCQQMSVHTETLGDAEQSSHWNDLIIQGNTRVTSITIQQSTQHCQANLSSCAWHSSRASMLIIGGTAENSTSRGCSRSWMLLKAFSIIFMCCTHLFIWKPTRPHCWISKQWQGETSARIHTF